MLQPAAGGRRHKLVACTVDGISGVCELATESNTPETLSLRSGFDPRALPPRSARRLQNARLVAVPWEERCWSFLDASRAAPCANGYGSAARAGAGSRSCRGTSTSTSATPTSPESCFDDLLITPVEEPDGWVAKRVGRAFCRAIVEWLSQPNAEIDDASNPHEQGRTSRICLRP